MRGSEGERDGGGEVPGGMIWLRKRLAKPTTPRAVLELAAIQITISQSASM